MNGSPCAMIKEGQDFSCSAPAKRFAQEVVIINYSDILTKELPKNAEGEICDHKVKFKLKPTKKGFRFILSGNGSSVFGTAAKTSTESGYPEFNHIVNMAVGGSDELSKCNLEAFSKGRFVVAMQIGSKIEVYGLENGLSAGDFSYSPQENGGFTPITLENGEQFAENNLPSLYESEVPGQEIEDFDKGFEAA